MLWLLTGNCLVCRSGPELKWFFDPVEFFRSEVALPIRWSFFSPKQLFRSDRCSYFDPMELFRSEVAFPIRSMYLFRSNGAFPIRSSFFDPKSLVFCSEDVLLIWSRFSCWCMYRYPDRLSLRKYNYIATVVDRHMNKCVIYFIYVFSRGQWQILKVLC